MAKKENKLEKSSVLEEIKSLRLVQPERKAASYNRRPRQWAV